MPAPTPDEDPAVAVQFQVRIDGQDIGSFTSCEGLGFEVHVEPYEEGGNNLFVHQLPGRLKYTNVRLSRYVTKDSAKIARWVTSMADTPRRTSAEIIACTPGNKPLMRWGLLGVIPVRWTGPRLDSGNASIASETLELAYHGFDPATTGLAG